MKRRIVALLTGIILTAGVFTGCGVKEEVDAPIESETIETPADAEEVNEEHTVYPLTIEDSFGSVVVLEKKPERIVSVAPSITETIFALEAEDLLVGRTDYCDYPVETADVESIGSLKEPNIEKIVELEADLVIASTHFSEDVYEKLSELDIQVIVLNPNDSFEGVFGVIEALGEITDENSTAAHIVEGMKASILEVTEKVKGLEAPSVYYVVGYGEFGDYTAGGDTFISEMIGMANGRNIADDVEGWSYSIEKIVEHDPDLLIVSEYYDAKSGVMEANGYKDLRAVKEGNVFEIDNNLIDRQGPRLAEGFNALARLIHPDAFK